MLLFKELLLFLLSLGLLLLSANNSKVFAQNIDNSSPDTILVKFKNQVRATERDLVQRKIDAQLEQRLNRLNIEKLRITSERKAQILEELRKNPLIEFAESDYIATKNQVVNDSYYSSQWGLEKIKAGGAWGVTHGSDSVVIAIVDTGIDSAHPDLVGKVVSRANFTNNSDADGDGHGTHVAGIASSLTNNNLGVAGVGFDTKLMSVKVLDNNGSGYYSWISNGIIWAADNGAKVINLSLGGTSYSATLQSAVDYAWSRGAVVVAAAGNSSSTTPHYPAFFENSIAVAATDSSDRKANYSNFGSWVDVAAPGSSILSTYKGGYSYLSGTSMATPFVSGLAGLLYSAHPDWSNGQVRSKIQASSDNIGSNGIYWMYGRINACSALDCNSGVTPSPTPNPSPLTSPSPSPAGEPSPSPSPSTSGDGLMGSYFNNMDLTALVLTRVDPTVNFNWRTGSPASSIGKDTFSVVWSGFIEPKFSDEYTIYTKTDDGVRLWVNDQLMVNNWVNQSVKEVSGKITLEAGVRYPIKLEYFENTGRAQAELRWSSVQTPKQIIPQSQLFSR